MINYPDHDTPLLQERIDALPERSETVYDLRTEFPHLAGMNHESLGGDPTGPMRKLERPIAAQPTRTRRDTR